MEKAKPKTGMPFVRGEDGYGLEESLSPLALRSTLTPSNHEIRRLRNLSDTVTQGSDRLPFEWDRDRIIHCRQFRKLAGKTQLLIAPSRGDIRTRLTHTMEVYQLATSMARRFNLNLAAAEAIALGHDVGHTPFGHAGEEALNEIMADIGGFHHAAHSVRTLDYAAYNPEIIEDEETYGLNLTFAVREGILKHGWFGKMKTPYHLYPKGAADADVLNLAGEGTRPFGTLESQVVRISDKIAYLNHDIDDLVLYGFEKILSKKIVADFFAKRAEAARRTRHVTQWFICLLASTSSKRVKHLVRDVYNNSKPRIEKAIREGKTIDNCSEQLVDFGEEIIGAMDLLYEFFEECIYKDERIRSKNSLGKECVSFLHGFMMRFYEGNPDLLPCHIQEEMRPEKPWWEEYIATPPAAAEEGKAKPKLDKLKIASMIAAGDAIADLTDQEAIRMAQLLKEPSCMAGMEELDRIQEALPNEEQRKISEQRKDAIGKELSRIFPFSK